MEMNQWQQHVTLKHFDTFLMSRDKTQNQKLVLNVHQIYILCYYVFMYKPAYNFF